MKLSVELLKEWFNEINDICFNGDLIMPSFKITRTRKRLGCFKYRYDMRGNVISKRIEISERYNRPEKSFRNTLAHEMIHLYIQQYGLVDSSVHGRLFKCESKRLRNFGFDTEDSDCGIGLNDMVAKKPYYILCYKRYENDYYFLCKINRKYYVDYVFYLEYNKNNLEDVYVFTSYDSDTFENLTECRQRLRGLRIDKDKKDNLIQNAIEILYKSESVSEVA